MELNTNNSIGSVFVANSVIAEIAGAAASRCYGVVGMAAQNVKEGFTGLIRTDIKRGVNVVIRESGVVLDIHIIVRYGININAACRSIVNRVRYAVETGVGVKVEGINVRVDGVKQN